MEEEKNSSNTTKKARLYRSPILDELENQMKTETPIQKLKRWVDLRMWIIICKTRKFWDTSYSGYIFKKKINRN